MKRYASVWLMDWPIVAWRWARAGRTGAATPSPPDAQAVDDPSLGQAFALIERTAGGLALAALTPEARGLGLRLGQSHADACAIVPALASAPLQPEATERATRRLALWMERFSPIVAIDPSPDGLEGLFLDLTGGQHLFGGEAKMANAIVEALGRIGASARIGVADTPGAAWALARHGASPIAAPGETKAALAGLPVTALRLPPSAIKLLHRFGLRRIGALYGLPRAALARRFRDGEGLNVVRRLDQALGEVAEPLDPVVPPALYRVQTVFAEPMTNIEAAAIEAEALAARLVEALERDGVGARRLRLIGFRVDGRATVLEVALAAPSAKPGHLVRLMKDKGWERLDLGFGIDALALSAPVTEPHHARQTNAIGQDRLEAEAAEAALIDRLSARLGEGGVLRPERRESWIPEAAETLEPYLTASAAAPPAPVGERPILLFDPPEPIEAVAELPDGAPARFVWRRAARRVLRSSGPERLSPEWWRTGPRAPRQTRDYYRLEDEAGGRYWVFRSGLYGDEAERAPTWWMHGLFP